MLMWFLWCLYSAVSLTPVKEQCFIRIIYIIIMFEGDLHMFEGDLHMFEGDPYMFQVDLYNYVWGHGDLYMFEGGLHMFEGDLFVFESDLYTFEGVLCLKVIYVWGWSVYVWGWFGFSRPEGFFHL